MGKLKQIQDLTRVTDPAQFMKYAAQIHNDTTDKINGNLEFDSNIKSQTVVVTFPKANTQVAVQHNLNKTSPHYLVGKQSAAVQVFDGTSKNTVNTIYLQASGAATVTLILT